MKFPAKKIFRLAWRSGVVLALLLVLTLVLCLDDVDHRPYMRAPYYAETVARLRVSSATNNILRGELSAGFGRAVLTPVINAPQDDPTSGKFRALPLAGYDGRKSRPATGVHDELYVKAVALRVGNGIGVMASADALIIPPQVTDMVVSRLKQELGLRREQIYLSATHTHCSLGAWGKGSLEEAFAGKFQPGARIWFAECIVTAVKQAMADLKPATFGHGSFAAPEFVRNRLVGELGKVDPEFSYAVVKQADGHIAVLGSYSAHATTLSSAMMAFSADYPGCWQKAVEEATGGMAVFFAGGVGSHSPVSGDKAFKGSERMGQALAQLLLKQLPQTTFTDIVDFGLLGLEVSLPSSNVRVADDIRLRLWITKKILPVSDRSFMQALRLNDTIWISTPCDFSGELALGIKDSLRVRGFSAIVTSFNGDYIGYVIPSRYYHLEGYEPRMMSFYGPNVPDYLDELARTLALDLTKN